MSRKAKRLFLITGILAAAIAVFALLSTEACFVPMGGGYWTFDQALV